MIEAAIFDMDGLMFDTEPVWGRCWDPAFESLGLPKPPEQFKADTRGTSGEEMLAVFHRYFGPDVPFKALYQEECRLVRAENAQHINKKPGLDDLLAWLDKHGIPMAVASSSSEDLIHANLSVAGVEGYFAEIVSTTGLAHAKPFPDVFLEAANRLNAAPRRSLVLEDSFNGVRAGHAGGFQTVMVPDLTPPTDEMREKAIAICRSLADVIGLLEDGTLG